MPPTHCKRSRTLRPRPAPPARLLLSLSALLALSACSSRPRVHTISLDSLQSADPVEVHGMGRAIVSDPAAMQAVYEPLGKRMGIIQVRSAEEYETLRRAAPTLEPCPDFTDGMVIGVVSRAGTPVNACWPVWLESVRVFQGAALANAGFESGSYLPDGATYIDTAYVKGLRVVLAVEINGARYYPE